MRSSSCDTASARQALIGHFTRGLPLIGRLFQAPDAPPVTIDDAVMAAITAKVADERFADPDSFFRILQKNLRREAHSLDFDLEDGSELEANPGADLVTFEDAGPMRSAKAHFHRTVDRLFVTHDSELLSFVRTGLTFEPFDLLPRGGRSVFFSKINHGYWEKLVALHVESNGRDYYRKGLGLAPANTSLEPSGFNDLFWASALKQFGLPGLATPPSDPLLAVAFHAGGIPIERAFRLPLNPVARGSMVGVLSFFDAIYGILSGDVCGIVADGSLPKNMVLDGSLVPLVAETVRESDLILFIVPTHLRDITVLDNQLADEHTLVIPATYCHELWLPVIATAAAVMEQAFRRNARVTIFVQAGALSYPLMMIAKMLFEASPTESTVRYYDLGQALDVAALKGDGPTGPWVRRVGLRQAEGIASPFVISSRHRP